MKIPLIGITADSNKIDGQPSFIIKESYVAAVEDSGGVPLLLCHVSGEAAVSSFISLIDGLLISGGGFDIDPKLYGEEPHPGLGKTLPDRTDFEIQLLKGAVEKKVPILGICGGHQLINVYFGGTLYQDIPSQCKDAINHKKPIPSDNPYHSINIYPSTRLLRIIRTDSAMVNSTHHQSIKNIGNNLKISSVAEDGVIEAIEYDGENFIIGVQWHPERLYSKEPASQRIFADFIKEAEKFRIKKGSNR